MLKSSLSSWTTSSRVVRAADKPTADELGEETNQMTVKEIIRDYLVSEAESLAQMWPPPPTEVFITAISSKYLENDTDRLNKFSDHPKERIKIRSRRSTGQKWMKDVFSDEEFEEEP